MACCVISLHHLHLNLLPVPHGHHPYRYIIKSVSFEDAFFFAIEMSKDGSGSEVLFQQIE